MTPNQKAISFIISLFMLIGGIMLDMMATGGWFVVGVVLTTLAVLNIFNLLFRIPTKHNVDPALIASLLKANDAMNTPDPFDKRKG